ncbi:protoporphyrinogen/coproporphyrinogen oxidase [Desulfomonile tiedjei]|uniref:Protoporphyrinogen oxidase n=1 Tax=Desulfomonile tiedjei (strain ATCC 49306 / DSM 6799 / DCB-1) TaxID=706587 RepID=I4CAP1_DESTA|nr:FAD-dependent oxidoreductase [Desulfomonile tiedjei]AFM26632.1 protoporphyrinogen oxidase [Desulfomonile tiedjei DSM 6799]
MCAEIAVIGAGIAGLAAAHFLSRAGHHVVVFEKNSFAGGRMSSEVVDGFVVEKAAYTYPEFHRNLTKFLGDLGTGNALVETPGTSSTFARGREYQIKIGSPKDFFTYKLLSLRNKKDMVKLFLYAQSLGAALNLADPTAKTLELEQESSADYLLTHYDEDILELIAYPIFCEIFLGTPEGNSKLAFLSTIKNLTRFKIFSFERGMGMLPERLAATLDVRLSTPVLDVRRAAGRNAYAISVGGDRSGTNLYDAVILAIPAPIVPLLCPDLSAEIKTRLNAIVYAPSIVAVFALSRVREGTSMISNLVRKDFKTVGTLVFDRHKGMSHVPDGKEMITAILCEDASRALFDAPDDAVERAALAEISGLYPGLSEQVLFSRVYRWEHGAVQLPPGAVSRSHSLRKALEEQYDDLIIAGDGLYKSSLEVSFNSGVKAAERLIRKFGRLQ